MYQRDQKEHMEISFAKYYEAIAHTCCNPKRYSFLYLRILCPREACAGECALCNRCFDQLRTVIKSEAFRSVRLVRLDRIRKCGEGAFFVLMIGVLCSFQAHRPIPNPKP